MHVSTYYILQAIYSVKLKEGAVRKGELVKISYVCMEEADSKIFDFMVN